MSPVMPQFQPPPPFTKQLMIGVLVLYVLELLAGGWVGVPMIELFGWIPTKNGFQLWQPLTHFFVQGTSPIFALLEILMLYFFIPPAQRQLGRRNVIKLFIWTMISCLVIGGLAVVSGAVTSPSPAVGLAPFLTALVVVFGLTHPNAQILLFFILPIQAIWLAWGSGLLAALNFLFSRDLPSACLIAGWIAGYLILNPPKSLRKMWVRYKHQQRHNRIRRFSVIDGGKSSGDEETYH